MKRIYCLIGLLTLVPMGLLSCTSISTKVSTQNEPTSQVNTEAKALETLSKLIEGFKQSATRGAASIYPDYYGGCFINDQKQLVVLTTNESGQAQIKSMTANASNLIFKPCEFSYNYLNQVMDDLADHMIKNKDYKAINFIHCYLLDSANVVVVELLEYSPAKIEEFKRNVSDSPAIRFESAEDDQPVGILQENAKVERDITELYPGFGISNSINAHGTIGYRVTCNNAIGFMTAGHVVALNEIVKNSEGTKIGVGDLYDYKDGGTVDAAFVKVDDSSMLTNKFGTTGSNISTEIAAESLLVEGAKIVKFGGTTFYSEGEILSPNVAVTTELPNNTKRRVTFHISTTLNAEKGDSGGPVLTRSGYKLVGILKARTELDDGTIVTALTRSSEIKKKFYCETY